MAQEVLPVQVQITASHRVQGLRGSSNMLLFTGSAQGPLFRGTVLPGGVDTQTTADGWLHLSARYTLEGTDREGHAGRLFIENSGRTQGTIRELVTPPTVHTACPSQQWQETAALYGTVEPRGQGAVTIHIFAP